MMPFQSLHSKGQYLGGAWVKGQGSPLESINPSYNTLLWQGKQATQSEIKAAFDAAQQALPSWSTLDFGQRVHYTKKFAQQIEKNQETLAELISMETGKPLWESQTEVQSVIAKVDLAIQAYQERSLEKKTFSAGLHACLRFKPQGIVVVLGAFNFPAHLSNGHILPALLAGNTILYKPSEQTPAVAEFIMQCWHACDLPAGVINCLQGDASCGAALLSQDIQGVYFTGSYLTGLRIHQQFSLRPEVILALEMGGNNPLVIADPIQNLDAAIYHTLLSTFITSGQRCTCARRLFIPNSRQGEAFLQGFLKASTLIKVAPYDKQPQAFMGSVISTHQALQHLETQKKLAKAGGIPLLSMQLLEKNTGLLSPGIMNMTAVSQAPDEEIFAPFVQVYRYETFDQAILGANQTRYGLCAALFSDKASHYQQFYRHIHAGLINWNRPTTGAASNLPFGGIGLSGNHRPSAFFAADYCSYPVASQEQPLLTLPKQRLPGIFLGEDS